MAELETAQALLHAGKVDQAVAVLHQILEADPDDADALYLSGSIAWQLRFHDQAIELYEQAIEVRPGFADAHLMLANSLSSLGRVDEAMNHWRRAIILKPGNARAHANIANALGKRGDSPGAVASAQRAINLEPTLAGAHFILGAAYQVLGRTAEAEPALREAVRLTPDDPECLDGLAHLLIETGRTDEARELLARVLARHPNDRRARSMIADALKEDGDYAAAARELRQLTADLPDWPDGWVSLANAERALGRFDAAAEALQQALALDPDNAEAHRARSTIRRGIADQGEVDRLNGLLSNPALDHRSRSNAGFALGKLLDDSDRFDPAFAAFATANALVHNANVSAEDRFVPKQLRGTVDRMIETFTAAALDGIGAGADASELPVFIVGMPRSGTSLVEQIVASHSQVFGAGELAEMQKLTQALQQGQQGGPSLSAAGIAAARALGAGHLERLRGLGGGAVRVVDKMPDNSFHLATVAAVYPGARVIAVRRDPRDTCLSCFFQRFNEHSLMFSYDLAECGHWAVAVDRIVTHWRTALPLRMLEVQYEDLVADLEGQSRRLVDFLGLAWQPACLDFHRTERTVATASSWQVRQPLYSRSVGRWRNYQRHLGPLLAVLRTRWPEL